MSQLTRDFDDIDTLLRASARTFSYPQTLDIASGVRARLDLETPTVGDRLRGMLRGPLVRVAAAAVAVALVALGAALATPQSREALADFFGLSHVKVEVVPTDEPEPPELSPASFAEPSTLLEAQETVDFAIRLPAPEGVQITPDAVYIEDKGPGDEVVIAVYEDEGYDLYQSAGNFFGKGVPQESMLAETTVNGAEALWIDAGGHIARSLDEQGRVLIDTERSVERATLFWEERGVTYRLETALSLDEAVRVAESLR